MYSRMLLVTNTFALLPCMCTDPLIVVEHTPHLDIDLSRNRSASLFALVWVVGGYTANLTTDFQIENGVNKLASVTAVGMESLSDSLVRVSAALNFSSGFETTERLTVNLTWMFHLFGPEGHSVSVSTLLDFETNTLLQPPARISVSSEVILAVVIPLVVIALVLSVVLSVFCILHRRRAAMQVIKPPVSEIRELFQQVLLCSSLCVWVIVRGRGV